MSGDAKAPASRSDLPTRFVAGVVMVAVALLAIYIGGWLFRLLVAAAAAAMMVEWGDMHRIRRATSYVAAASLALMLLIASGILFNPAEQVEAIGGASFEPAWSGFAVAAVMALVVGALARRVAMAWGFLYIAAPAFALIVLEWAWFGLVLWAMVVTWATDIFAYAAGRSIGGPKLAPRISPNKTWAGLAGGMIGAGVLGGLIAAWLDLGYPFLALGAPMGLLAQGGDLYESWVKRRRDVKDSGTLLPGHGGVLDRLDGLMPVALVTLLILMAGWWTG
jgi:phosphatidate cytidylyltransferase